MDGLVDGQFSEIKKLCKTERMVSFLDLTSYIKDEEIIQNWWIGELILFSH